ncbi:hypothetical protein SAMD00019534_053610 [Acytostelium subglobosum LB1]|uniref:hypothetical protein n=1 Tax=Acytostelium subglobosum LB1 TaxID=1410327 RepID=UPI0006449529|nr:hypothetical protein SAMD00019534_053610 [Acytostelium subglobosum LB1]GAM22186.1 hypothetical protein SAMD00019534_053610 [Acytostelium subglobosum LB1]|eukprot:XP_012755286.1 hypothetical protein SAMD00019534_053610 [Acytostelium subglobosum LB1]
MFNVQTANLDATNRHPTVNAFPLLADYVVNNIDVDTASISTLTEVSGSTFANHLDARLPHHTPISNNLRGRDFIVTTYDNNLFVMDTDYGVVVSGMGKFQSFRLFGLDGLSYQVIAAHLPHKSGRALARQLISDHFNDVHDDVHHVIVLGDFNCQPTPLSGVFDDYLDLSVTEGMLTTATRAPDNILHTDMDVVGLEVFTDTVFTHCPIRQTFYFDD